MHTELELSFMNWLKVLGGCNDGYLPNESMVLSYFSI